MTRHMVLLASDADRATACQIVRQAPRGSLVEVRAARRTIPQNARLWVLLGEISRKAEWGGKRLTPDVWKVILVQAFRKEVPTLLQTLDGLGVIPVYSTSAMTKQEMADFQTWIEADVFPRLGVTLPEREMA